MKNQQSGFTLIELIAVIVVLWVLAAVAVPKFVDLSDAARQSAVDGAAGALAGASALNNAANVTTDAGITGAPTPTATINCDELGALLDGGLDSQFELVSGGIGSAEGDTGTCTVRDANDNSITATFTAYNVQ